MIKRLFAVTVAIAMTCLAVMASGTWTLQGKTYSVDTLFHAKIGPGTTQTSLCLKGSNTLKVFYITTDLTNPYVDIRVAQAGTKLTGGAKLSTMSNANTDKAAGIEYFAGVNADFFGNSQPIGSTVVNGDVYKASNGSAWINWYMNADKVPGIELLQFRGTATGSTSSHPVSAINEGRYTDYLVIYNNHYGSTTGTNAYGAEVLISSPQPISYNGTYKCRVEGAPVAGAGSMAIPSGKYVLSGHGTAAEFVKGLKDGDEVTLNLDTPLETGGTVLQMAGGQPIILKDGVTLETQNALDHLTALNPRTAVGYNAERTKLVLLVVDGRSMGGSAGVVSKTLADMMRAVGCNDAMNFDGGGSSELYTRAFGVRNMPSDGNERTVVNSVWAVSVAPVDATVAELAFPSESITLPKYGYYEPYFYAYNKYGVLQSTDFKGVTLSCDPALGQIIDGKILFANGEGTHKLTATYGDVTTDITVTIGTAAPRARLEGVMVDSYRDYRAEVVATVGDMDMSIDNKALTWSSSAPAIASVDAEGVIHGVAEGTATVTGTVDDFTATLPVTVQIPANRYVDVDAAGDVSGWTTAKTGLSTATLSRMGKGFAVDYKISSTRGTALTVKPVSAMDMYALPDSIRLVVNPGNTNITKITFNASPKGVRAVAKTVETALEANKDNVISVPVSDFCDADDFSSYPFTFTSVALAITGTVGQEGRIELPYIQGVHTAVKAGDGVGDITFDSTRQPSVDIVANRGEVLELGDECRWTVYNLSGSVVASAAGTAVDTATFMPGVYILSYKDHARRLVVK